MPAYAKNETFDIFTYKAPAGYEKDTSKQGMVTYTRVKGNKFCMIGIYMSRQSSGISQRDFENEWNELVAKPFGIGEGNVIKEDKDSGWDILLKADKAQTEGTGEFYVTLTSFSGHGRVSSVIINYNDESMFQKDIDNFFNNFDTVKDFDKKQPVASTNTAHAIPVSGGGNPNLKGKGVVGVWMGIMVTSSGFESNIITGRLEYKVVRKFHTEYKVFLSDGTYSKGLPYGGLYNLNIAQSQQDEMDNKPTGARWGIYNISGNNITVKYNVAKVTPSMTLLNPKQIKESNDTYDKCESVDGLKLDGIWGWTPDVPLPQDDDSLTHAIKFSKNGTFIDYGIFTIDLNNPNAYPNDAPGSGTYQIRDFTLILNYSDGRVVQKSFVQYKDVSPTKSIIYINGNERYKL